MDGGVGVRKGGGCSVQRAKTKKPCFERTVLHLDYGGRCISLHM